MGTLPWRLVTVDIDGTLTRGHGWAPIADAFGVRDRFDRTTERFRARAIDEDEHLCDLLDLATGRTVDEVLAVVAATPKLDGIAEGVTELHRGGARVALLSHNPTYVTAYYRSAFGFDDDEGVEVPLLERGRIGPPSGVHADKLASLHALLRRGSASPAEVVHVGDGWADVTLFPYVGGGIAVNTRWPDVAAAADVALVTTDFRDVVRAVGGLLPRPPTKSTGFL